MTCNGHRLRLVCSALLCFVVSMPPCLAAGSDPNVQGAAGLQVTPIPASVKGDEISAATLSGGGLLAVGTVSGRVAIVDRHLQRWRGGWQRQGGPAPISRLAFSQDEAAIAAVTDTALLVWRLDDPSAVKMAFKGAPDALALSPGGRLLAVTRFGVSVYDVASRRLLRELQQDVGEGGSGVYQTVAFTADGAIVAAASAENIDAWHVSSGKSAAHGSCKCGADGVALSATASLAVVGTSDARALLWDVAAGRVVKGKKMSAVMGDHVYGTAVSLNGELVAAGMASGEVAVWNSVTGVIVARAKPSRQPITRITASDDGQVLLVEGQKAEYVRGAFDRWLMILTPDAPR